MPTDLEFAGILGGKNSQLAYLQPAFDSDDYVVVDWIDNENLSIGHVKQYFGLDEGGHPINMYLRVPKTLTGIQALRSRDAGSVLLQALRYSTGGSRIVVYEKWKIVEYGLATVGRIMADGVAVLDSASRNHPVLVTRQASADRMAVADIASPSGPRFRSATDSVHISESIAANVIVYVSQAGLYRSQGGTLYQAGAVS